MIKSKLIITVCFFTLTSLGAYSQTSLPKGDRAPEQNFTGTVWLYPLSSDSLAHWSMAKVTFEKGARSKWHYHAGKQIVIGQGTGYLKEKGKPLRVLHNGDIIIVEPGTVHWHGANEQEEFEQLVINPDTKNGVVTWLDKVTDEEYKNANKGGNGK